MEPRYTVPGTVQKGTCILVGLWAISLMAMYRLFPLGLIEKCLQGRFGSN
mgnify:CR=1 FL=1|jgi:hypothetical protein